MKTRKRRKEWPLVFLSLLSIRGFIGIAQGDWMEALWVVWLSWLSYLIPVKKE